MSRHLERMISVKRLIRYWAHKWADGVHAGWNDGPTVRTKCYDMLGGCYGETVMYDEIKAEKEEFERNAGIRRADQLWAENCSSGIKTVWEASQGVDSEPQGDAAADAQRNGRIPV